MTICVMHRDGPPPGWIAYVPDVLSARGWTPAEAVGNLVGDLAKIDHGVKIVHNVPAAARRELKKAGAK